MKSTERTTAVDGNAPQPGDHAAVHKPAPSVQLADDVQLPAVILALNAAKSDPDFQQPAPIAAAMQGIVDSFYQDLAAGATDQSGDTLLIRPGPDVDRARERANETYRRLFGDEAFNKMIMQAALEARLPVDSGSAGN